MNLNKLPQILRSYPAYRQKQAQLAIFKNLITDWQQATSLPKDLIALLNRELPLEILAKTQSARDKKTVKAAMTLEDGKTIEAVLMRHADGRNTACLSTQVGCNLACQFCATGQAGFQRNLLAEEIVLPVLFFNRLLRPDQANVNSVVFMGMGEPFLNYDQVLKAARLLNDPEKFNIGGRHISISTSGIVEGIKKLSAEKLQINLAISVHAPSDALRSQLMPINRQYPLKAVLMAAAEYLKKTKRRLMIEYLLLKDVNDSIKQAKQLAEILKKYLPGLFFVNLINYNPTQGFEAPGRERIKKFKAALEQEGIEVVWRYRFGSDIQAACGQLAQSLPQKSALPKK